MTTIKDIAREAGVSTATVSLALRQHPRISKATTLKITALAKQMNYRADPMLQALNKRRWQHVQAESYCNIAFVTWFADEQSLYDDSLHGASWRGALQRAEALGYALRPFCVNTDPETQKRQVNKLLAQGVRGLLIGGNFEIMPRLHFDWTQFATITIGLNLRAPRFHSVRFDHRADMEVTCRELRHRKYKRIGFCVLKSVDLREGHMWRSTFLFQSQHDAFDHLAVKILDHIDDDVVGWIKGEALDAVIFWDSYLFDTLRKQGLQMPEDVGFVSLRVGSYGESGLIKDGGELGSRAFDLLHLQIQTGQWGVPEIATNLQVPAVWRNGHSLKE
ncbi:LacI family DNA-binding transcriptional regulator [Kiritimatiellota bacterium B12222]|nr:LacI family DNA-binding transcriptional regulator [Kiritimatiellota bacterium B12222]